jgi:hypothetical protein
MAELFDALNAIFYKKEDYEYKKKDASLYGLCLWLSHDASLCNMVNELNYYIFWMPDEVGYKYFFNKVPRGKRFLKWVKKDKEKDYSDLAEKYGCSIEEIKKTVR